MIGEPLLDAIVTFGGCLSSGQSVVEALEELMTQAAEELGVDGAVITLRDDAGRMRIVAAQLSSPTVHRVRAEGVDVHSLPLFLDDTDLGRVDFYRRRPDTWTLQRERTAQMLVETVSSFLALARKVEEATTTAANIRQAMDRNAPIEQAKGMVASTLWVSPQEAFELIRAYARTRQTKVLDVATQLMSRQIAPEQLHDRRQLNGGRRQRQAA